MVGFVTVGNVECWERFVGDDVTLTYVLTSGFSFEKECFILRTSDVSKNGAVSYAREDNFEAGELLQTQ